MKSRIAPAAMGMNNDRTKILQGIKDAGVPMLVVQGDADEAVPVANTRMWVDTMKELNMDFVYKEGAMHGPIIGIGCPMCLISSTSTASLQRVNASLASGRS